MPPLSILVKPSSGNCQYRCRYCFYADVMSSRETASFGMMQLQTLECLIRGALAYGEGDVTFGFQGGEPTLCGLDFYQNVVSFEKKYARSARVHNSIQTNGGLIDANWADFLAQNGFLVGLSIDGARETHDAYRVDANGIGTYARTLEAAEMLKSAGAEFNILCVVTRDIARRPKETYEALKPYRFIQFIPCIEDFDSQTLRFSPSAEEYTQFLIECFRLYDKDIRADAYVSVRWFDNLLQMLVGARPESCGMNGRCACYFVVEADGGVYPCDFYVLDKWRLGNIREHSLAYLSRTERAQSFVTSSVYMSPECRACRWYTLCRGGCRRDREPFDEHGKPGLNRYCHSFRTFFETCNAELRALAAYIQSRNQRGTRQ